MRILALLALMLLLSACQFVHENKDADRRPEVAVGTGATILMPGQAAPVLGAPTQPSGAANGAPQGPDVTMIGGSSGETSVSTRERKMPLIGPLTTLLGYPFWIFGKKLSQKADDEAAKRAAGGGDSQATAPASVPNDERQRVRLAAENQRLLEELRKQQTPAAAPSAAHVAPPAESISDELAALRRRVAPAEPTSGVTPTAASRSLGTTAPAEAVDRDGDGRPDLWVYREAGRRAREAYDEDRDGRVDRRQSYAADGTLQQLEEDLDGDGVLEATTLYRDGQPSRKRMDTDGNGLPDTWSFYDQGEVVRNERDRDGDGFRDLVLFYEAGALVREEEDQSGDGRADVVIFYRDGQVSQRDEDLDHDGQPDVQSYYEAGKLVRRQLHSPEALEPTEGAGS